MNSFKEKLANSSNNLPLHTVKLREIENSCEVVADFKLSLALMLKHTEIECEFG